MVTDELILSSLQKKKKKKRAWTHKLELSLNKHKINIVYIYKIPAEFIKKRIRKDNN